MNDTEAMHKFRTVDEHWLGGFGEKLWANVFRQSGFSFIPLHKIERPGAPMIEGREAIVLPDFELLGRNWTAYIDSKAKRRSVVFRLANETRHGIDADKWEHYQRTGALSRRNVGLAVVELFSETLDRWSGSLLVEAFVNLGKPIRGFSDQAHMVYWPRKRFCDIDSLSPLELVGLYNGRLERSYRSELDHIFNLPPPPAPSPQQKSLFV